MRTKILPPPLGPEVNAHPALLVGLPADGAAEDSVRRALARLRAGAAAPWIEFAAADPEANGASAPPTSDLSIRAAPEGGRTAFGLSTDGRRAPALVVLVSGESESGLRRALAAAATRAPQHSICSILVADWNLSDAARRRGEAAAAEDVRRALASADARTGVLLLDHVGDAERTAAALEALVMDMVLRVGPLEEDEAFRRPRREVVVRRAWLDGVRYDATFAGRRAAPAVLRVAADTWWLDEDGSARLPDLPTPTEFVGSLHDAAAPRVAPLVLPVTPHADASIDVAAGMSWAGFRLRLQIPELATPAVDERPAARAVEHACAVRAQVIGAILPHVAHAAEEAVCATVARFEAAVRAWSEVDAAPGSMLRAIRELKRLRAQVERTFAATPPEPDDAAVKDAIDEFSAIGPRRGDAAWIGGALLRLAPWALLAVLATLAFPFAVLGVVPALALAVGFIALRAHLDRRHLVETHEALWAAVRADAEARALAPVDDAIGRTGARLAARLDALIERLEELVVELRRLAPPEEPAAAGTRWRLALPAEPLAVFVRRSDDGLAAAVERGPLERLTRGGERAARRWVVGHEPDVPIERMLRPFVVGLTAAYDAFDPVRALHDGGAPARGIAELAMSADDGLGAALHGIGCRRVRLVATAAADAWPDADAATTRTTVGAWAYSLTMVVVPETATPAQIPAPGAVPDMVAA